LAVTRPISLSGLPVHRSANSKFADLLRDYAGPICNVLFGQLVVRHHSIVVVASELERHPVVTGLGVHEKTLYRLILKTDAAGWYMAQRVRLDLELDDSISGGDALKTDSQRNSWKAGRSLAAEQTKFEER
jgi:hypothetical protein